MSNIKIIFFLLILWNCLCRVAYPASPPQDQDTSSTIVFINEAIKDALMNREASMGILPDQRGFSDESFSHSGVSFLADNLRYLFSIRLDDRDRDLAWQKRLLRFSPDPFLKVRLQKNLASDELRAARRQAVRPEARS